MIALEQRIEALLFLAPDPVPPDELADALRVDEDEVAAGLRRAGGGARGPRADPARAGGRLDARLAPGRGGGRAAAARRARARRG